MNNLNAEQIKKMITTKDLPDVEIFDEIGSTNDYCLDHHFIGPHIVAADYQISGKGQRGHSFYSPKNTGFYMTITLPVKKRFVINPGSLTAGAAVAVLKTFQPYLTEKLGIKWINDIYRHGRKCGGILIETLSDSNNEITSFVIGVGLNLFTHHFPDEVKNRAGYLFDNKPKISRNQMMAEFYNNFAKIYFDTSIQEILNEYRHLMIWKNRSVRFKFHNQNLSGKIIGIDEMFRLIILGDNIEHHFNFQDASQVRLI